MCDFNKAVGAARNLAAESLKPVNVLPFSGGEYTCPWLELWLQDHKETPNGILLLQDWDRIHTETAPKQSLADQISWLADQIRQGSTPTDQTIRNLGPKWLDAYRRGEWLIMNAIWGLPLKSSKCGYLGDPIHKAAYPIWHGLVVAMSTKHQQSACLVTAGSWSRFSGESAYRSQKIDEYLKKWRVWVSGAVVDQSSNYEGTHHHTAHPSCWHTPLMDGPPAKH